MNIVKDTLNTIIGDCIEKRAEVAKEKVITYQSITPHVVNIHTDVLSEPSNIYVRKKGEDFEAHGIEYRVENCGNITLHGIKQLIEKLNNNPKVTSIIVQLPLRESLREYTQYILNLIKPEKDIDRLSSVYTQTKEVEDLPITSKGLYNIFEGLYKNSDILKAKYHNIKEVEVALVGNGLTTNKRLLAFMQEFGMNVRVINSKTTARVRKEILHNAAVIISAVGVAGHLKIESSKHSSLYIISPTIDNKKTDFDISEHTESNLDIDVHHHNTYGKLGRLTVVNLVCRAFDDAHSLRVKEYFNQHNEN